ncbi:MAG: glycosyltransferase [Phycisphaerales bacterium]|nr:MAG: glycosyltransferase [Phycisphaerales bacterium]
MLYDPPRTSKELGGRSPGVNGPAAGSAASLSDVEPRHNRNCRRPPWGGYPRPVRFHAIMLVRDEADVLSEAIKGVLGWADSLWVLDNGSIDGSWEIVQEAAGSDPRVRAWGRVNAVFSDALRAAVFHDARTTFGPGDWIARVDADEVFHEQPSEFVRRLGRSESFVCGLLHEFVLLRGEAEAIGRGEEDLSLPISERRRWWTPNHYPEPRLFRYRRSMRWPGTRGHPWLAGVMATERIQIRHYRWRTPEQARRRWALREAVRGSMPFGGAHWSIDNWRAEGLRTRRDPGVSFWRPGTALAPFVSPSPVTAPVRRFGKAALARCGVQSMVDRVLPGYAPADLRPEPAEIAERYLELLSDDAV